MNWIIIYNNNNNVHNIHEGATAPKTYTLKMLKHHYVIFLIVIDITTDNELHNITLFDLYPFSQITLVYCKIVSV